MSARVGSDVCQRARLDRNDHLGPSMPKPSFIISTEMCVPNIECDLWYKHVADVVQSLQRSLSHIGTFNVRYE